jgi:hypothetical protein
MMCIICNVGYEADKFLTPYDRARSEMRHAIDGMEAVIRAAPSREMQNRYKRAHHKMVRLLRDWNRIEQERENGR